MVSDKLRPIRGQYSGHMNNRDQLEANIEITLPEKELWYSEHLSPLDDELYSALGFQNVHFPQKSSHLSTKPDIGPLVSFQLWRSNSRSPKMTLWVFVSVDKLKLTFNLSNIKY